MNKRILSVVICSSVLFTSCVSSKVYKDLENRHAALQQEHDNLSEDFQELQDDHTADLEKLAKLRTEHQDLIVVKEELEQDLTNLQERYEQLQDSYDALEANSSSALAENSRRNRQLLKELEEKKTALQQEQERLRKLEENLASRSRRINELEAVIAEKDAKMNKLKEAISKALVDFEGKGLTVEQRDGKVYVSMENKLLFGSGSWAVGPEGREAVAQLANVLAENPDIAVLIEGHTDNVPYNGTGALKNNWDLSTKRATAIVELLRQHPDIKPQNLTAAGRGEYAPVASNETAEGRAKNRRIEVILTPELDRINQLLQEIE